MARFPIVASVAALLISTVIPLAAAPDGKQLFATHCASCHGEQGRGDGAAAVYVFPKPRDFSKGLFKVRSTPDGAMPADQDLFNTVTRGMPGSAMPSFAYLGNDERLALVAHVKTLIADKPEEMKPIAIGQEPPPTAATLAEGRKHYAAMQCAKCHGETGKGDGPSANELRDSWGYQIKVRDFTSGVYLGGPSNRDLYLRFTTGMSGTPMPSYADSLTDAQRWALVHYVQSLRVSRREEFTAPADHGIRAGRAGGLLTADPTAKAWDKAPECRVPMMMLWPCEHPLHGIRVKALHDGKKLAVLLEWASEFPSRAAVRAQDFADGAAIQFSLKGTEPFVGMGDAQNPVNLWQWKAAWQADSERGRADIETAYANRHVDFYPRKEPIFITARAAGNLLAAVEHKSPVEDLNAAGFGTLEAQPAGQQNVSGKGVWTDGKWRVVFLRSLQTKDEGDQQFKAGGSVPAAFAVWGGAHGDRDGQKAVSTWYRFSLEK